MARILVAEDDESTRELLTYLLTNAGHTVASVVDGQSALKMIREDPPEMVLLDIMLPELHGFAVCHQVKSDPALKKIRIMMLSAKAFPADRRQAEEVGADAFLSKPVNPTELVERVRSLLS